MAKKSKKKTQAFEIVKEQAWHGHVGVQEEAFDLDLEIRRLKQGDHDIGAIVSFTGCVRHKIEEADAIEEPQIKALHIEHYPGMTERMMAEFRAEAMMRWKLSSATIIHRVGSLMAGDDIVLVITAAPHRKAAFDACQFLMDWLKNDAPLWKAEETIDGKLYWVAAKESDAQEKARWNG
ncbi:MAG: molybdenum cofactor biosynthesis protein MoaE [Alphaproteobacteria bacterium]